MALSRRIFTSVIKYIDSTSLATPVATNRSRQRNYGCIAIPVVYMKQFEEHQRKKLVKITFVRPNGKKVEAFGTKGDSIWTIASEMGIMKLNKSCDGSLKCSNCRAIFNKEDYNKLPEPRSDEILNLQQTSDSTDTSRLCCQIRVYKYMDGIEVKLPSASIK